MKRELQNLTIKLLSILVFGTSITISNAQRTVWILGGQSNMVLGDDIYEKEISDIFDREGIQNYSFIRSASGGQPIAHWRPGKGGYDNLMSAIQRVGADKIAGMFWFQGESNASVTIPTGFKAETKSFLNELRAITAYPEMPIIMAQIGNHEGFKSGRDHHTWSYLRETQRQLADEDDNISLVSTYDGVLIDHAHYTDSAYINFGKRFGEAAINLAYKKSGKTGPILDSAFLPNPSDKKTIYLRFKNVTGGLILEDKIDSNLHVLDDIGQSNKWKGADVFSWSKPINQIRLANDITIKIVLKDDFSSTSLLAYAMGMYPKNGFIRDSSGLLAHSFYMLPLGKGQQLPGEIERPKISFKSPQNNITINTGDSIPFDVLVAHTSVVNKVEFRINGDDFKTLKTLPYSFEHALFQTGKYIIVASGMISNTIGSYDHVKLTVEGINLESKIERITKHKGEDGSIKVNVSNGKSPYNYLWSTGAITDSIGGLKAGTYTLTVTDAKGLTVTRSFIIRQPRAPFLATAAADTLKGIAPATINFVGESIGCGAKGAYLEKNGFITIEAEKFQSINQNTDIVSWDSSKTITSFSGSGYITYPTASVNTVGWNQASEVTYAIDVQNAGSYNIWMRRLATSGSGNSCFIGIDGIQVGNAFDNASKEYGKWFWYKGGKVNIPSGIHTFNVRRREKAPYSIDQIILATDDDFKPDEFNEISEIGLGECSYTWDFGDGNNAIVQNPSHVYTQTGKYNAVFEVTNGTLTSTDTIQIEVNLPTSIIDKRNKEENNIWVSSSGDLVCNNCNGKSLYIMSLDGRLINTISNQPSGIYLVFIDNKTYRVVKY